ncbi:hypothetical protein [Piscirickettsia litoralis]|uniref:hypothetical protein n=1 Tax=Piscirickettsia litoralis TaxID=1891921 RepID=UPI001F37B161|nr:hypothetical protein [Piscirickettsia litoralis]
MMQNDQGGGVPHIIYYTMAIAVAACAIFIYFHSAVIGVILPFKMFEVRLINLITGQLGKVIDWAKYTPTEAITAHDLYAISLLAGSYVRWLTVPIAIILTGLLWKYHPGSNLSTKHSMLSLLQSMKDEFYETRPIIGQSLDAQNIDEGPWKMALTPLEFMKVNQLLNSSKKIDEGLAKEVFIKQLGRVWTSAEELTDIEKLFLVFYLHLYAISVQRQRLLQMKFHLHFKKII